MTDRRAIILPGARYTAAHPLLYFTAAVVRGAGWDVAEATWPRGDVPDPASMVLRIARGLIDEASGSRVLLVGKSLGSLAIPLAAERELAGIWLTPLLREPAVAAALPQLPPATLLVGSSDDETWDSAGARASRHQVVELSGANHGLEHPDDALRSVEYLRTVVEAVTWFLAGIEPV